MVDVKKLVTAFLVLAAITSSIGLVFVDYGSSGPVSSGIEVSGVRSNGAGSSLLTIGKSAYVEPLPSNSALSVATPETRTATDAPVDFTKSSNLTESLVGVLGNKFAELNPNGPTLIDGESALVPPDPNIIIEQLSKNPELISSLSKDWEAQLIVPSFKIIETYTQKDLLAYGDALNTIIQKNFVASGIADLIAQETAALNQLTAAKTVFDQVELDAARIAVPKPVSDFHETLLTLTALKKSQIALAEDQTDPLKSAIVLNAQEQKEDQLFLRLSSEFQKINQIVFAPNTEPSGVFVASMNALFGIPKAHAFLGFGDIVHDPLKYIWDILKNVYNIAKQVILNTAKNHLIKQFVTQTVDWIKNGGTPRFITNWKSLIVDTAKGVAAETLFKIAPGICSYFSPLIIQRIKNDYQLSLQKAAGTSCTLEQIVANVKRFYQDFNEGGWRGYGATLFPSGNFSGSLFANSQVVIRRAEATSETKREEAVASKGFIGTKICGKTEVLTVADIYCQYEGECGIPGGFYEENDAKSASNLIGYDYLGGFVSNASGTFNACAKGNYITTTPGGSVGAALDNALPAPIHKIINSSDIVGLISVLVDSAINKLVSVGDQGIKYATPSVVANTTTVTPPPDTEEGVLDEANTVLADKRSIIGMMQQFRVKATSTIALAWFKLFSGDPPGGYKCYFDPELTYESGPGSTGSSIAWACQLIPYPTGGTNWRDLGLRNIICPDANTDLRWSFEGLWDAYKGLRATYDGVSSSTINKLNQQITTLARFIDKVEGDASSTADAFGDAGDRNTFLAMKAYWKSVDDQLRQSQCSYPYALSPCEPNWGGSPDQTGKAVDAAQGLLQYGVQSSIDVEQSTGCK